MAKTDEGKIITREVEVRLDLGAVTDGDGKPDPFSGYITYEIDGKEGEIELHGPLAAAIATKIVNLARGVRLP